MSGSSGLSQTQANFAGNSALMRSSTLASDAKSTCAAGFPVKSPLSTVYPFLTWNGLLSRATQAQGELPFLLTCCG
jgi:hypothetical protein